MATTVALAPTAACCFSSLPDKPSPTCTRGASHGGGEVLSGRDGSESSGGVRKVGTRREKGEADQMEHNGGWAGAQS